jgi:hypothetical protein
MTETYKLNPFGGVQRLSDGAFIPEDERNADWRAYQEWLAAGNTPQAADPLPAPPPPPPPPEPIPLPTRWQIDQQTVIERLEAAHRFGAFMDVLDDSNQLTRELWRTRYRIWNDDPFIVGLLQQASADPMAILAQQS